MKSSQLTMFLFLHLFLLSSCEKVAENELHDKDFLKNEWKVESVVNESKRFKVPSDNTIFGKETYLLKFINDSCFYMNTSVNYAGGKYRIVSDGYITILDYQEWTEVGNSIVHQRNFDKQLLSVFNGAKSYSYTMNKLIIRGEKNKEIVFTNQKSGSFLVLHIKHEKYNNQMVLLF